MKFRPLHDRILVKRLEEKETVKGGIIIPDTAKEKPQEGLVEAVGNGKILDNGTKLSLEVKEGDHILFGKYSGTEIKIDGVEHLILREDEVRRAEAAIGRGHREMYEQARIVKLTVIVDDPAAQLLGFQSRQPLQRLLFRQQLRRAESVLSRQQIVEFQTDAIKRRLPP